MRKTLAYIGCALAALLVWLPAQAQLGNDFSGESDAYLEEEAEANRKV